VDELAAFRSVFLDSAAVTVVAGGGMSPYSTLRLQGGNDVSNYGAGLHQVANFLDAHASQLNAFIEGGGDVNLVLNHTTIAPEESSDKTLDLWLAPELLKRLVAAGIGLRIIGWAEAETASQ